MDSEKVKEIKKIAVSCAEKNKPYCRNCSKGKENDIMLTCRSLLKDMLALINELESKNEMLAKAGKRVTEINEELSNAHEKIEEQLKDQIAELESENERLLNEKWDKEDDLDNYHEALKLVEEKNGHKPTEAKWDPSRICEGERTRTCSNCHITQTVNVFNGKVMFKYCPYCGAKMV